MNKYTKMRLMTSRSRQNGRDGDRRDYDRPDMRDGYSGPESRFRDRDGREHYDNGRYAPRKCPDTRAMATAWANGPK